MNVFSFLNPQAMMSFAFWYANLLHCSSLSAGLKRNFSSSARGFQSVSYLGAERGEGEGRRTSKLNNERAVEDVLKPLGEDEGNHVAEVHRVGRGSATGVEVEGLLGFVAVEDQVEFAVDAETGRGKGGSGEES
jgi:hypothetical protein